MKKLAALILVLATVALESGGEVLIPFPVDSLLASSGLNSLCQIKNETVLGWYKVDGNVKIDVVASRSDVKDKPGVVIKTVNQYEKTVTLIIPKGSPVTAGGKYECRGDKNKATLAVQVRFSLDTLKKKQSLHLGKDEKIVLGALAYPLAKFTWKKNGTAIDFAGSPRLTQENDGSISITNVKESDADKYEVNINWEGRNFADEVITVDVIEKPRFISTPTPNKLTGITGYDYTFCCNHTGIPKPTLKWFKIQGNNEVGVDVTNPRYSVNEYCMSIKTVEQNDAATYKCTATNSAGEASATVAMEKIGVKPSVDPFAETSLIKSVNKPLEVVCMGQGDPPPTMEWTSGGKVLVNQNQEPGKSTMKFEKLRLLDTGNFTCTARNALYYNGTELHASRDLRLDVIAKPLLNKDGSPTPVYSFLGNKNDVLVRCVFGGFPDPSVNITRNGVLVANGTSVASLDIRTNKRDYFGDYVCTAKNLHGTATHTVKLVEAVKPGKPTNVTATKTCKSIQLSWKPPLKDGGMKILHYVIAASKGDTKYRPRNVNADTRVHKIELVFDPETTYKVDISARNGVGVGPPVTLTVTTNQYCKPGAPTISTIGGKRTTADLTVSGPDIKVTWQAPQDNGFDNNLRYRVAWRKYQERVKRKSEETKWEESGLLEGNEYEIKGLKKGKYEIRVNARSQAGDGRPDMRVVNVENASRIEPTQERGPVAGKRTGGLSKGVIAGIVIAILLIVLITIDLFCCFFNSCGLIFCCQRACCGGKYSPDGKSKKDYAEMEKLSKNPAPEKV